MKTANMTGSSNEPRLSTDISNHPQRLTPLDKQQKRNMFKKKAGSERHIVLHKIAMPTTMGPLDRLPVLTSISLRLKPKLRKKNTLDAVDLNKLMSDKELA